MTSGPAVRGALFPLTPLYRLALSARELRLRWGWEPVRRLRFPVISVGNLSTGGTGKTPFAIALAKGLQARGTEVDVLSRGYGRQGSSAARVHPDGAADDFGDEPLVIAREAGVPVYVGRERYEAGLLAEAGENTGGGGGLRAHILDDGFQHRQLFRDVDIVLMNRADWEDWLLPAGSLREPLEAVRRASVLVIAAEDPGLEGELRGWGWKGVVWRVRRGMDIPASGSPVFAFCGIARPDQFFAGLEAGGARLAGRRVFKDHHRYTDRDVEQLHTAARAAGAVALVTTAKDEVRLLGVGESEKRHLPVLTAGLHIAIENEPAALDWLLGQLGAGAPQNSTV